MQFREIKTSNLKERLSKYIKEKFGVTLPPEKMIPVLHRSCVEQRLYAQDERGAHYESDYTLTQLWKYRQTMEIDNRQIHVDERACERADRCPSHESEQIQMLRAHGLAENSIDDLPGMWDESDLSGGWADSCNQKTEGK